MDELLSSNGATAGLILLAVLAAIPAVVSTLRSARRSDQLDARLQRAGRHPDADIIAVKPRGSLVSGLVSAFAANAQASGDESELSAIRFKLMQAGYLNDNAVAIYYAARFVGVVAPQIALFFALPWLEGFPSYAPLAASVALALAGLAAPGMFVGRRIDARRQECGHGFPDLMDLLVACVEAGLSLDAAVARVSEEISQRFPTLSYHLRMISLELRAGRDRQAAWKRFADRVGLEEASALATMLRQSEEMGTSLGATMRVFASDMRQRRVLTAEEKAMALPAKLTLPLILFVFPVLLGVLITPAIIRVNAMFSG